MRKISANSTDSLPEKSQTDVRLSMLLFPGLVSLCIVMRLIPQYGIFIFLGAIYLRNIIFRKNQRPLRWYFLLALLVFFCSWTVCLIAGVLAAFLLVLGFLRLKKYETQRTFKEPSFEQIPAAELPRILPPAENLLPVMSVSNEVLIRVVKKKLVTVEQLELPSTVKTGASNKKRKRKKPVINAFWKSFVRKKKKNKRIPPSPKEPDMIRQAGWRHKDLKTITGRFRTDNADYRGRIHEVNSGLVSVEMFKIPEGIPEYNKRCFVWNGNCYTLHFDGFQPANFEQGIYSTNLLLKEFGV